jgi:DNA modification methylase
VTPYYEHGGITIYHGDCREVLPSLRPDVLVTDPPYPNNAGHFNEAVSVARDVLVSVGVDAFVFWSELEHPPVPLPLVAVHVWHRANVNGRPYEPVYQFALDGRKRRSEVFSHAVEFENATGAEYLGHPTQKPVALMQRLIGRTRGLICDPFAGVGSTLRAAKNHGREAIGIEISERYCEIAARRLSQAALFSASGDVQGASSPLAASHDGQTQELFV